jgi:hypothetical protein
MKTINANNFIVIANWAGQWARGESLDFAMMTLRRMLPLRCTGPVNVYASDAYIWCDSEGNVTASEDHQLVKFVIQAH